MSRPSPVFVSVETTSFSGATLLAFLLNAHPEIASIGEMNGIFAKEDPNDYLCSCGQKIKSCDFWQAVTWAMHERGHTFDVANFDLEFALGGPEIIQKLRRGSFRNNTLDALRDDILYAWPGERQQIERIVARNQAFIEAILAVTGKKVLVDTAKDRIRLRALRKFSDLDVRVIHLIRDVRGVVASWLRRGRDNLPEATRQWVKWHRRLEIMWGSLPADQYLRVRYEDLCRDVPATLKQIHHFCGVDDQLEIKDFREAPHHIVGNKMRLANLSQIKLDERWKESLTPTQLREIDQLAGKLNQRYGYS
jgi:hypothetical protein